MDQVKFVKDSLLKFWRDIACLKNKTVFLPLVAGKILGSIETKFEVAESELSLLF